MPGSPAVGDDGTIYVGALNGNFYALNPNGTLKWSYPLYDPIGYSSAIGPNGAIYVGAGHTLWAFNPNGTVRYANTYDSGDCLFLGGPAIEDDGTVYIGSNTSKLYAFNSDLTPKWTYGVGFEAFVGEPVIGSDGTVYFKASTFQGNSSPQRRIFAIDKYGSWKWDWSLESWSEAPPAIGRDGTIYYTDSLKLHALDQGGHKKWEFTTEGHIQFTLHSSPAIGADGTIYVTGQDLPAGTSGTGYGVIYAINPDGSKKWVHIHSDSNEVGSHNAPAVGANGSIYFGSRDTNIYKVVDHGTYPTQSVLLGPTEGQVNSSPAIGHDGTLYIGCAYSVRAMDTGSYGPANSSWPLYRANLKRTAKVKPWAIVQGHIRYLRQLVHAYHLASGTENSLVSKLDSAFKSLDRLEVTASANMLKAFGNEVSALKNKKIPIRQADAWIVEARKIISSLESDDRKMISSK